MSPFSVPTNLDDVLIGSDGNDTLAPGRADTLDTIDGGLGIDTLAFYAIQSDTDDPGSKNDGFLFTQGITVTHSADNTGAVVGGDGVNVSFSNIEIIAGTRFADNISGSSGDDWLIGSEGNDILTGGAGAHDLLDYSLDVVGGGQAGVVVNLETGTATDGFGDTDTISDLEDVIGTQFDDVITGSSTGTLPRQSAFGRCWRRHNERRLWSRHTDRRPR